MGLYDRDYIRRPPTKPGHLPGGSGAGWGGGGGSFALDRRLRMLSVTTWIIIINVLVFVVGNGVLGRTTVQSGAGNFAFDGVTKSQIDNGVVDRKITRVAPNQPGYFVHPIRDKATGREIGMHRIAQRAVVDSFGHFSTGKALEGQVWRFLTFQFLHVDIAHLLFNMLGLWFVGGLVEEYLGAKRYAAFYLLCGICGALSYLLLNLLGFILLKQMPGLRVQVPALLFDDIYTPLVGASAGVFGVLLAAAFIAPTSMVEVLLVIPMRLRTAVYLFVGLATLNLLRGGHNAGGDAAHVGGAIGGAYFIRHTHLLREFFDVFGSSRSTSKGRVGPRAAGPRATGPTRPAR